MGLLPIMEKGAGASCHADWPLFYMNDFSRLGLVVGRLSLALSVLRQSGYRVLETLQGSAVSIDSSDQVIGIVEMLASNQVESEIADLVSCAYQG